MAFKPTTISMLNATALKQAKKNPSCVKKENARESTKSWRRECRVLPSKMPGDEPG